MMATDIIMAEKPTFGDRKSRGYLFCSITTFPPKVQTNRPFYQYSGQLLNLLELRSITGCPGGTCSVFTRAFRAKRELHCKFLGKKKIIITSKHGTTIFFSHYNLFLRKLTEKLARKAHINTEWVYWIVLMPFGHHIILYSLNLSNPTWLPYR